MFRRMQQIAVAIFIDECREYDLTPVQFAALVGIRENPGTDATRLSAVIAFDRSTLGNVLERLEKKKLIKRTGGKDDKRIKRLNLTQQGRDVLSAIMPSVDRAQDRMLAPLTPAERNTIKRLLRKLIDGNGNSSRGSAKQASKASGA